MSDLSHDAVVVRSDVPAGLDYQAYREYLRFDFWYSCAYCSISEIEAVGIGFQIDHFEPQSFCCGDMHAYSNLMWSCASCNNYKSNIWPSDVLSERGYRFIRPDAEDPSDHFNYVSYLLYPKTPAGEWSIEVLFLNRDSLKELRRLRERLFSARKAIAHGIHALNLVRVDRFKGGARTKFIDARAKVMKQSEALSEHDLSRAVVRVMNHSPFLDPDPCVKSRTRARRAYLASLKALIVGEANVRADSSEGEGDRGS